MAEARTAAPREGLYRPSVGHFLAALVVLIVTMPFVDQLERGEVIEAVLMTLVLLTAVVAVGGRRRSLIAATVLMLPAVAGTWVNHLWPGVIPREPAIVVSIVFVAFIIVRMGQFILTAPRVDTEVLLAAASTYLMLGVLWTFGYTLVARTDPDAFGFTASAGPDQALNRFQALYFSFCTLTTLGYGDIVPRANAARVLAMTEATTGTLFITMVIARLVALYTGHRPHVTSHPAPHEDRP